MDERSAYRGSDERVRYSGNGNGGSVAHDVSETAQAVVDSAKEVGTEAIDLADEYLRPIGLSLRDKPVMTLAAVAGVAVAIGALWTLNRQQNQTQLGQLTNQFNGLLDQFNRVQSRWR